MKVELNVNGRMRSAEVHDPAEPLLWVLRDRLGLTGTKFGCGLGVCGACTVHLDGSAVRSCQVAVSEIGPRKVLTIEGLSSDGSHPVQQAWLHEDVAQCGFCQAGQIMCAAALLSRKSSPSRSDVDREMSEIICRCGTYERIRKAIDRAARVMK